MGTKPSQHSCLEFFMGHAPCAGVPRMRDQPELDMAGCSLRQNDGMIWVNRMVLSPMNQQHWNCGMDNCIQGTGREQINSITLQRVKFRNRNHGTAQSSSEPVSQMQWP